MYNALTRTCLKFTAINIEDVYKLSSYIIIIASSCYNNRVLYFFMILSYRFLLKTKSRVPEYSYICYKNHINWLYALYIFPIDGGKILGLHFFQTTKWVSQNSTLIFCTAKSRVPSIQFSYLTQHIRKPWQICQKIWTIIGNKKNVGTYIFYLYYQTSTYEMSEANLPFKGARRKVAGRDRVGMCLHAGVSTSRPYD